MTTMSLNTDLHASDSLKLEQWASWFSSPSAPRSPLIVESPETHASMFLEEAMFRTREDAWAAWAATARLMHLCLAFGE